MRLIQKIGALALLTATSGLAQAQSYFHLQRGGYVRGELLADDGGRILVQATASGNVHDLAYGELSPRTLYRVRLAQSDLGQVSDRLALADHARRAGLFVEAKRHYFAVARLDASMQSVVDARLALVEADTAAKLLTEAREDLDQGHRERGMRGLAMLVAEYPESEFADEARGLMGMLAAELGEMRTRVMTLRPQIARVFDRASDTHRMAVETNRRGLLATKSTSRADRHFRSASASLEKAKRSIEKTVDSNPNRPEVQEAAKAIDEEITTFLVEVELNRASLYSVQQSYKQALTAVNRALAFSPGNELVLQTRARIEQAVAESSVGFIPTGAAPLAAPPS